MKCNHVECKKETYGLFAYCKDCLIFMIAHSEKKRNEKHINCDYNSSTKGYCKCICNKVEGLLLKEARK